MEASREGKLLSYKKTLMNYFNMTLINCDGVLKRYHLSLYINCKHRLPTSDNTSELTPRKKQFQSFYPL